MIMGMFDELKCKYPLPVEMPDDTVFQTKDTPEQCLDMYEIREDGVLFHTTYDIEDRSKPNAEGVNTLSGCMTRTNQRQEKCHFTGEIEFYTFKNEEESTGWIEFKSDFIDGEIQELILIEDRD